MKSAMSGSVVVTSRRTTMVFLPSAEIFQEETAFSVSWASRALSKAVGNPATSGILPVCRNSFGVRIETSKNSALLGNQRETDRQTDRETETEKKKQQQQQKKKKKIAFGIKLNEKQYHRADCGQNDCFFTSKTEEALQFFCPNNGEKLLLLQAGSCMTILCLLHVDIPMVSIVVPKVKQLAQCRLDMASVCTAYIHCHTPHPVPSELKGY